MKCTIDTYHVKNARGLCTIKVLFIMVAINGTVSCFAPLGRAQAKYSARDFLSLYCISVSCKSASAPPFFGMRYNHIHPGNNSQRNTTEWHKTRRIHCTHTQTQCIQRLCRVCGQVLGEFPLPLTRAYLCS